MLKKRKYKIGFTLAVVALITAGVTAQQNDIFFLIKKNFSIFSKTYESITLEYVDDVDPEILMRNGINAMLETLDPYTVLYDESQNEQAEIFSRGNYAGIGLDAGYRDGEIVIIAPVDGGPAQKAGLRAGDIIVAVDDVSTEGMLPEEVSLLSSGEEGSEVKISVKRYGIDQVLNYKIKRERIEVSNITYSGLIGPDQKTGYIRLAQFGNKAADELRTALLELNDQKELNGLILDLRDNPGGILQEAVSIVDKFIEPGITVVETRGRVEEYNQAFLTEEPVLFQKPLIILMNEGSASASEVVAGSLQDLDRALIIGERSFGKGLVQIVKPMPYNTSLKLTISRYYIPSGRSIQSVEYTHLGRHSAKILADSSRRAFKTRNGRTVYEGRGIDPDIHCGHREVSLLELELEKNNVYFDFATRYESQNDSYTEESLSDSIYEEFITYLEKQNFNYETDAEKTLRNLESELEDDALLADAYSVIQKQIEAAKQKSLSRYENEIRKNLHLELVSRYQGQEGKTKANLNQDEVIKTALEFISNQNKLANMLSGK